MNYSRAKDPNASFHHFPLDLSKKQLWIEEFGLTEGSIKHFSHICSRHFRNRDPANGPDKTLGARVASLKKHGTLRSNRATKWALSLTLLLMQPEMQASLNPSSYQKCEEDEHSGSINNRITAVVGEPLRTDYEVHELFSGITKKLLRHKIHPWM